MTPLHAANWVLLLSIMALTVAGLGSGARLYRRVRGRQLSGTCRAISEHLGVSVWLVRGVALGLALLGLHVVLAYLWLDLALAWHPDDRELLWSHRARAWLAARLA